MEKEILNHFSTHIFINDLSNIVLKYLQPCQFCYYLERKLNTGEEICCHLDSNNIGIFTKNEITLFKLEDDLYLKFINDDDYKIFLNMENLFNGEKLKHQSKERFGPVTYFIGKYCDVHERQGIARFNFMKDEIILPKNCFAARQIYRNSFMIELLDTKLDGLEPKICFH